MVHATDIPSGPSLLPGGVVLCNVPLGGLLDIASGAGTLQPATPKLGKVIQRVDALSEVVVIPRCVRSEQDDILVPQGEDAKLSRPVTPFSPFVPASCDLELPFDLNGFAEYGDSLTEEEYESLPIGKKRSGEAPNLNPLSKKPKVEKLVEDTESESSSLEDLDDLQLEAMLKVSRNPEDRRRLHCLLERKRRSGLKRSLEYLRGTLPDLAANSQAGTSDILKTAIDYISRLKAAEAEMIRSIELARRENERLRSDIMSA